MFNNLIAVFVGGGVGSLARFSVTLITMHFYKGVFPLATLVANILSSIIFGLALFFFAEKMQSDMPIRLLLLTGICGGFSTFSAFSYETVELVKNGNVGFAFANILISVVVCFGIIYFFNRSLS